MESEKATASPFPFKVGQKILINKIPGRMASSIKKLPFEAEIFAIPLTDTKDPGQANRVLVAIKDDMFTDAASAPWVFQNCPEDWKECNAKMVETSVVYVSMGGSSPCFEIIDHRGLPEAHFKLEEKVKLDDEWVRIIGYNSKDETYLVEAKEGDKLTVDMIKKMDVFIAHLTPPKDGTTSVRCKIVRERDIIKDKANRARMEDDREREMRNHAQREKEEVNPVSKESDSFWETIKGDAKEGITRSGADQIMKAVQGAFVRALKANGQKKQHIQAMQAFFATDVGNAILTEICGYILTYVPVVRDHKLAKKFSKEFRVQGMEKMGNIAMDTLLPHVFDMLSNIPDLAEELQPLVADRPKKIEVSSSLLEEELETIPAALPAVVARA